MAKKPSWTKIRTEYVTGDTSYKKLAEKYKVSFRSISWKAKEEHWVAQKKQHCENTVTKAIEAVGDRQASDLARINTIADGLLDKIEEAVGQLGTCVVHHRYEEPTEEGQHTYEYESLGTKGEAIDTRALKQLTDAIRGLKEVKGLQSELARQEQEARIANLRRQAEAGTEDKDITITLEGVEDLAD